VTEEAGLLSRRGRTGQAGRLLHPLVRSFLEGRLLEAVGPDGVAEITYGSRPPPSPSAGGWRPTISPRRPPRRRRPRPLLVARVDLGSGGAQAAIDVMRDIGLSDEAGWIHALQARGYLKEGNVSEARGAAQRALERSSLGDPTIPIAIALSTLTTVEYAAGEFAWRPNTPLAFGDCRTTRSTQRSPTRWCRCRVDVGGLAASGGSRPVANGDARAATWP